MGPASPPEGDGSSSLPHARRERAPRRSAPGETGGRQARLPLPAAALRARRTRHDRCTSVSRGRPLQLWTGVSNARGVARPSARGVRDRPQPACSRDAHVPLQLVALARAVRRRRGLAEARVSALGTEPLLRRRRHPGAVEAACARAELPLKSSSVRVVWGDRRPMPPRLEDDPRLPSRAPTSRGAAGTRACSRR